MDVPPWTSLHKFLSWFRSRGTYCYRSRNLVLAVLIAGIETAWQVNV